jgi:hypothetical protein
MESAGERCGEVIDMQNHPGLSARRIWTIINNAWGVAAPDAFLEHVSLSGPAAREPSVITLLSILFMISSDGLFLGNILISQ